MPETYFGLDFASPGHTSGYCVLDATCTLLDIGLAGDDTEIIALIERSGARTVAIDCPLGLPAGLDCLDPSHPCTATSPKGIRESELAVRALGYGLYFTTKKTIIRAMAERGIALRRTLEASGLRVLEVYPFATKRILFGKKMPKKTTPEGVKPAVADACLACAERLLGDGKKAEAIVLYKSLAGEDQPKHVRLAATRGLLAAAGKKE